ncbi:hypothetical protein F4775DRAFT_254058 [Biscogniauxia sp. FL1348]|nr:hypothetical protein F4775DRAFT_254058 [Biscogniauxia sp. FL1348]
MSVRSPRTAIARVLRWFCFLLLCNIINSMCVCVWKEGGVIKKKKQKEKKEIERKYTYLYINSPLSPNGRFSFLTIHSTCLSKRGGGLISRGNRGETSLSCVCCVYYMRVTININT